MFPNGPKSFKLISTILLIISLFLLTAKSTRRRVYHKSLAVPSRHGMIVYVLVGSPPQTLRARFNTEHYDFIVMEIECLKRLVTERCPRYCSDSDIAQAVGCSLKCETFDQTHWKNRCANSGSFWANTSTSFKHIGDEFMGHYSAFGLKRNILGQRAWDRVQMAGWGVIGGNEVEFTRGILFDSTILSSASAIIGLAPSAQHPSLMQQLQLDNPTLTLHIRTARTRVYNRFKNPIALNYGTLEKAECHRWVLMKAPTPHTGWKFPMGSVFFYGRIIAAMNVVQISLGSWYLGVPADIIDDLIAHGNLKPLPGGRFEIKDLNYLRLSFTFGGHGLSLESDMLMRRMHSNGYEWYQANFVRNPPTRFGDEALWTFGLDFLRVFCFGYDYRHNFTLMGWRRGGDMGMGLIF